MESKVAISYAKNDTIKLRKVLDGDIISITNHCRDEQLLAKVVEIREEGKENYRIIFAVLDEITRYCFSLPLDDNLYIGKKYYSDMGTEITIDSKCDVDIFVTNVIK